MGTQRVCIELFYRIRETLGRVTLASRGLEGPFSKCAVVSVFCSGGKLVLVLHTPYVLRVPYICGVVLFFLIWQEIVFGMYVLSVQYSCAVVSVFLLWRES